MDLLILGGTVFLGRQIVETALARGHSVTLFNRGRSNPGLFPDVEQIHGDRDGGLDALAGRQWDAVVDPSGYVPRLVRDAAARLADAAGHYTFISSISVYDVLPEPHMDETAATGVLADPTVEDVTGETYGPLKVLCEQAAEAAMPGRVLNVRAGLIVGPHDPTDRFTYWPVRVARGGDVLAPGRPERSVQVIDVRDLAAWTLDMAERRQAGTFNVTGRPDAVTMGGLLETCRAESGSDARFVWVDEAFLLERGVGPWMELPLWVPESDADRVGFMRVSVDRALAAGLRPRPIAETVRDTLAWAATLPPGRTPRAGLDPEKEAATLAAWAARSG
jgi:2'-hydroxyisoflavone reductase